MTSPNPSLTGLGASPPQGPVTRREPEGRARTLSDIDHDINKLRHRRSEVIEEFGLPIRDRYQVVMVDSEKWELD